MVLLAAGMLKYFRAAVLRASRDLTVHAQALDTVGAQTRAGPRSSHLTPGIHFVISHPNRLRDAVPSALR